MKAIHIPEFVSDPSTLQPSDIPIPQPSQPDDLLIRITHCSPQHADILHAQGKHQNNNRKRGWLFPPFVLGFDFAGVVASVGKDNTKGSSSSSGSSHSFRRGDRVFGASVGAFAEYITVRPSAVRKVPARLTNATACAMSGQAVSYAAVVSIAKVQKGETVLVSGASGGLGSVCCMVSKALGAKVIALTGEAGKAGWMKEKIGVDHVVVMEGEKWTDEVLELTGGKGVEVVLDNTGMVNDGLRCLAYFGRIVILGFAARKGVMEEVKMNKLLLKSATVVGYRFGESGRRYPDELERIWNGYFGMLEQGTIQPVLSGRYDGLETVGRALKDLHDRRVEGKVVVNVADEKELAKL